MGIDGQAQHGGRDEADNVIRFPRDWFGSTDDLVPIGSAADRLEAEAAAAAERERSSALSADDFWGEGSGALHQAVDVPGFAGGPDSGPLFAVADRPDALPVYSTSGRGLPRLCLPRVPHVRVPHVRAPLAAALLAVMVIGALALFLSGGFGTRARTSPAASTQAAPSVKAEPSAFLQPEQDKLVAASQSALQLASRFYVVKSARTRSTRHVNQKARPTRALHPVRKTRAATAVEPAKSSPPAASSDLNSTPTTDSAPSDGNSVQSNGAASTLSVAPVTAGPSSPGTAGSNCDPQCT